MNYDENKNLMFFFENRLTKEYLTKLLKKTKIRVQKKTIKSIDLAENKVYSNFSSKSFSLSEPNPIMISVDKAMSGIKSLNISILCLYHSIE